MNKGKCVNAVLREYLEGEGYGGLYHPSEWCSCLIEDLQPCNDYCQWCMPGYKFVPECDCDVDADFYVVSSKDELRCPYCG